MLRFLAFFLVCSFTLQGAPEWTTEAMMLTKPISDVQLSPDNQTLLFVASEPHIEGHFISRIYKSTGDESQTPFSSPNTSSFHPRWSPDGKWIAFLSTRDESKRLYLISASGGEAAPLTEKGKHVEGFAWSPDSKSIAYVMQDDKENEKTRRKTSQAYEYGQKSSVYRLWVLSPFAENQVSKALTTDDYCVRGAGDFGLLNLEFDWSPDSKRIIFAYSPEMALDSFYLDSSIAEADLNTGQITPWKKMAPYESTPRYSPDGQQVAYLSGDSKERYATNHRVVVRKKNGSERQLLAWTSNEGPFLFGPNLLGWTKDGNHLLFYEPHGTQFHIMSLPVNGQRGTEIKCPPHLITSPNLSFDKTTLCYVGESCSQPPEVYCAKLNQTHSRKLTTINRSLLSYPELKTETVTWNSQDGKHIEGLLTYPVDYQKGKKHPLLVVVHGGPMSFFQDSYLGKPYPYPLAAFAQNGFMILRPNPRGSCGYGKDFRCGNYRDWGGQDYQDIMAGVDDLVAKGKADSNRLGIMGWSYGGFMTAWTITQTPRFKAASMGAGVSNLVSISGTMDLERFISDYFGDYNSNRHLYEERSPINHAAYVTTPCLIQHGTADKRVPTTQSHEFYRALKQEGKETTFVLYPGMSHHLSDPQMLKDAMDRNLAWFQEYLQKP